MGSGLSPCLSIYDHLIHTDRYDKIANLFGEKNIDHIPHSVLASYTKMDDRVYNQICLSREMHTSHEKILRSGYVQEAIYDALAFLATDDIVAFVCGLPAMCDDVRDILLTK